MELMIAARSTVTKLQLEHGFAIDRVYTGSFMTSLDMAGLSYEYMIQRKESYAYFHMIINLFSCFGFC